ncbi:signal peptidase I [Candidatus Binatia bacterium]|nr:signal peptidase I [Candidatus Binatia bacterium]
MPAQPSPTDAPSSTSSPSRWRFWKANRGRAADASHKSRLRQNVESLALAVLVALVVRSSVVEAFWVPSGSMLPTIQIGDHLFVNKLAYGMHIDVPLVNRALVLTQWSHLDRGDIVVFVSPVDRRTDLIKRVVAVGGDTVEIRNKRLYINGEAVDDSHATFTDQSTRSSTPRDNFGPVTVPEGKFFVLGDNRDQSYDSRYWGFANERDVKGKATFIYWSGMKWDRLGRVVR